MPGQLSCPLADTRPGLSLLFKTLKMSKAYKNLEMWRQIFPSPDRTGATAETRLMGRRILFTIDPENIKAILATQFGDFGKGAPFHREWKDFLGDSIFTTDGALWHGSRQLIRPQFIKDRVSDLHTFEKHMHDLFRTIANGGALDGEHQFVNMEAGNGRRVDIADLFFRFTLDTATDFLLGQDVKSLRFVILSGGCSPQPARVCRSPLTTSPAPRAKNSPRRSRRSRRSRASSPERARSTRLSTVGASAPE